tara:strand:- start:751 stop:993 length:243 start_codon:yes stop_codon:yes gene_type:complete
MTTKRVKVKCESEETDLILEALGNYTSELYIGNHLEKSVKCKTLFDRIKKATEGDKCNFISPHDPGDEHVPPKRCEVCDD